MLTPLMFAALVAAVPAAARPVGPVDFDQGVDAKGVLHELRGRAREHPYREPWGNPAYGRTERDCAVIALRAGGPTLSDSVTLESREYEQRCYPTGPNHAPVCHDEWVWTERRHVRVEVVGRGEMLPWEEDAFEVCLDGRWLNYRTLDASHEYALQSRGDTIVARAGRKVASLPDPVGILGESFRYDGASGSFAFGLKDRWAGYYAGEKTVVSVQLKRHREGWFDDTLLQKELSFDPADAYAVRFADFAGEMKPKPEAGKKYYVKWRFKRVGKVSKESWQKWWESDKAVFGQAAPSAPASFEPAAFGGACWFRRVEKGQCVYRCSGGRELRQPARQGNPYDPERGETIACPQFVLPF